MAIEVARLYASIGVDSSQLQRGLRDAESQIQRTASRLQTVARGLTLAVSAPLAAAGVAAIRVAADYERALNVFRATSGATAAEMAQVAAQARALGADLTLPNTSAKDAVESMLELSRAGLSVRDAMSAARGVLQLSAAAQVSNAEAAEITANALNAFRMSGDQATRVADLLAAASKASSGSIQDVAYAMQASASVAAMAGVPIEDLTTAIALMANAGIKGSDAGTSIKTMLLSLMAPTEKARELMSALGFSAYDSFGRMKSLCTIARELTAVLAGMTQEQQAAVLQTLFGTDAIRGAINVLARGAGAFEAMRRRVMEQGAAAGIAAAQTEGLSGALEALNSAIESLATSPAVITLIHGLAWLIRQAAALATAFGDLPVPLQYAAVSIATLAAATGPLLLFLSQLMRALPAVVGGLAAFRAAGLAGVARVALGGSAGAGAAAAGAGAGLAARLGTRAGIGLGAWAGSSLLDRLGRPGTVGGDLAHVLSRMLGGVALGAMVGRSPLAMAVGAVGGGIYGAIENVQAALHPTAARRAPAAPAARQMPMPRQQMPMPRQQMPMPRQQMPMPRQQMPMPRQQMPMPRQQMPARPGTGLDSEWFRRVRQDEQRRQATVARHAAGLLQQINALRSGRLGLPRQTEALPWPQFDSWSSMAQQRAQDSLASQPRLAIPDADRAALVRRLAAQRAAMAALVRRLAAQRAAMPARPGTGLDSEWFRRVRQDEQRRQATVARHAAGLLQQINALRSGRLGLPRQQMPMPPHAAATTTTRSSSPAARGVQIVINITTVTREAFRREWLRVYDEVVRHAFPSPGY